MKWILQLCYSSWIVSHDWPLLCRVIFQSHCVNTERNTLQFLFLFLFLILIPFPMFISILFTTARSSYSHVLPLYIRPGSSSHFLGFSLIPCHNHSNRCNNTTQSNLEQNRTEQSRTPDLTSGEYLCLQDGIFLLLNCQLVYLTIGEIVNM